MISSFLRGAVDFAERQDGPPHGDRWALWIGGAVVPLVAIALAIFSWSAAKPGAVAVFLISAGMFAHFHFFWGLSQHLQAYSGLGKVLSAVPLVGSIWYGLWYFAVRM